MSNWDYEILRTNEQFTVYEVWNTEKEKPLKRFHVVEETNHQIKSCIYGDMPSDGGTWISCVSARGIQYISNPRTRSGALSAYYRVIKQHKGV